jgi:hypothetical protein
MLRQREPNNPNIEVFLKGATQRHILLTKMIGLWLSDIGSEPAPVISLFAVAAASSSPLSPRRVVACVPSSM